jgi:hypothetical protein
MKSSVMLWATVMLVVTAMLLVSSAVFAEVRLDGTWPASDPKVGLDAEGVPRSQALKRLGDAAGWSLVIADPPSDRVDLHVKDQPARRVLQMLLADGTYVATRDGDLVSVRRGESVPSSSPIAPPKDSVASAPAPPAPPAPAPAPEPTQRGEDRTVTGGHLRIEANETVHNLSLLGGSLEVLGTITGDLTILGGRGRLASSGHVFGNASVLGGKLRMDDGARIDGDINVLGGSIDRAEHAKVGGAVDTAGNDNDSSSSSGAKPPNTGRLRAFAQELGDSLTGTALLFVFGAILIAVAGKRFETMRVELAARPMRSLALGVLGLVGALALIVVLCVTLVGIPLAIVGVLAGALGIYAGIAAVLTTTGEALLRHRTQNSYVHLAVGCALLLVLGNLPLVGKLVTIVLVLLGFGVLVATRAAGLLPRKGSQGPHGASSGHPFR